MTYFEGVVTVGIVVSAVQILTNLLTLKKLKEIKVTNQELLDKFDAATNAASDRVAALIASIKASGATLTPAQEAEATAIQTHLDSLGSDPNNPVPPAQPVATTP